MTTDMEIGTDEGGTGGAEGAPSAGGASDAGLSTLSYEQARAELVRVVQQLEAGGSTLEESLALWERGERLSRVCREWLEGARARLDAVLEAEAAEDADTEDEEALEGLDEA